MSPSLLSARPPGTLTAHTDPHSKLEEPCPQPKLGEAPGHPRKPQLLLSLPPHTCVWRRHLRTEELPAPAADKPPGWVFQPLPLLCPSCCSCPFSSLADKHTRLPALPFGLFYQPCLWLSTTCPGRAAIWGPLSLPPRPRGPRGYLQGCHPASPGALTASAPLHRGGLTAGLSAGPCAPASSTRSVLAWPPAGRPFSSLSELSGLPPMFHLLSLSLPLSLLSFISREVGRGSE